MRLPIYPIEGDEKWEILRKIIKKLESKEIISEGRDNTG